MKIAIVSTYPPTRCGIAMYTKNLVHNLIQKDAIENIIVLADRKEGKGKYIETQHSGKQIVEYRVWGRNFRDWINVVKILRNYMPDIVHIQHDPSMYSRGSPFRDLFFQYFLGNKYNLLVNRFCKKNNVPLLYTLHGIPRRRNIDTRTFIRKIHSYALYIEAELQKPMYECLTGKFNFIVHSEFDKKKLECYRFKNANIAVIPMGVCTRQINTPKVVHNPKVLLHFGFIQPYKGIHNTIKALEKVLLSYTDIKVVIAGSTHPMLDCRLSDIISRYIQSLERYVKIHNLQDNVRFLFKYLDDAEKEKVFMDSDILMLPYENAEYLQSAVLADACAFGLPVIATNAGAMAEFVSAANGGWLVNNARDIDELAHVILSAVKDDNEIRRRGENLYNFAKKYASWGVVADKHVNFYKEIVSCVT